MNKMIAIPVKTAIEYGEDTNAMFSLLSELREMLMTETRLKKHHRPYLHLREQIDEKVKEIAPVLTKVAVDIRRKSLSSMMRSSVWMTPAASMSVSEWSLRNNPSQVYCIMQRRQGQRSHPSSGGSAQ